MPTGVSTNSCRGGTWISTFGYGESRCNGYRSCTASTCAHKEELLVERYHSPDRSSHVLVQHFAATNSTPSNKMRTEELRQRVKRAVARLSESDREVILMRHFENLTNQQVAQALGLQESAATMRYSRALYRLRTALLEDGSLGESEL